MEGRRRPLILTVALSALTYTVSGEMFCAVLESSEIRVFDLHNCRCVRTGNASALNESHVPLAIRQYRVSHIYS